MTAREEACRKNLDFGYANSVPYQIDAQWRLRDIEQSARNGSRAEKWKVRLRYLNR